MNRLSGERAAYLRHAASQKIDWYPWSEEAFERARREDKPVFLSSGAIWCHWCHVMAKECFEDEEVIRLLNENCINIKLDRDERPEIDRVYQQAVAAMGSGGGWPLTVFLTPDKKPFFGGTYFPPEDAHGRPGFRKVIRSVVEFYKSKRGEALEYSEKLIEFLQPGKMPEGVMSRSAVTEAVTAIIDEFDPQNGGFGKSPKFPMPGAMEFLINQYFLESTESRQGLPEGSSLEGMALVLRRTLESMAKGGFHDHLGGGFHRYSVDEAWIVPHFEKMADDNSWLLRNYVDAYCLFGDEYFKDVAYDIIRFVREVLSDPGGGFYASQDADVTPDDEGGYFTWTVEDFRKALNDDEYAVLSLHLLHERGAMHHDKTKRVLFVAMESREIAAKLGLTTEAVDEIVRRGKAKLLAERFRRKPPLVDTTLYTSLNGMLISAYLKAYRGLTKETLSKTPSPSPSPAGGEGRSISPPLRGGDEGEGDSYGFADEGVNSRAYMKEFALKSLDRIMELRFINGELFHAEGISALLDDYIHMIDSFIAAYEVTGERVYLNRADELMEQCISGFWDKDGSGFFDSPDEVVGVRLKGIEDIPHPSSNALAITCLLKLSFITGNDAYFHLAEKSLGAFFLRAHDMGIHSGYYYCTMDQYFNMLKLNLEVAPLSELAETARFTFNPYVTMEYGENKGFVTPCRRGSCYESIYKPDDLAEFLKKRPQTS